MSKNNISSVAPIDVVSLVSMAALSMGFNLMGRIVNNKLMVLMSTPIPCVVFMLLSRVWTFHEPVRYQGNTYTNLVGVGLLISSLSDVLMSLEVEEYNDTLFVVAVCMFCLVQILYGSAFTFCAPYVHEDGTEQKGIIELRLSRCIPFVIYCIMSWTVVMVGRSLDPKSTLVLVYITLQCITTWRASARVGTIPGNAIMQLFALTGMILFTLCDTMIALHIFAYPKTNTLVVIDMSVYWVGQLFVALSCNEHLNISEVVHYSAACCRYELQQEKKFEYTPELMSPYPGACPDSPMMYTTASFKQIV
ncbi:8 TM domain-containing transmembrane protein [Acrasis kona]|uniref:8 TM domain-containing transmembrane protein n=1 Tax=Acrasis kona TaxID=1008807 RepID=A0AAW2Z9H6_9EUKA